MPIDVDRGSAGLTRWLHALRTRASVLMITAHPDDEDGGMLAFETRGTGARAALLTLNRGEGGQNAMSPDMYDALGLVRTEELLAADRYYGVDQYWTRVVDYGFSKTREEALEKWDHDRVLSDVVRVIRMTRPLVITAVFVGAATDGHGQHQVSGQMAQEAFLAAGDPNEIPGADSRRPAALVAAEDVRARAVFRRHAQRHVRLRHRQIRAGAIFRLHQADLVDREAFDHAGDSGRRLRAGRGADLFADRPGRPRPAKEPEQRRGDSTAGAASQRLSSLRLARALPRIMRNRSSMESTPRFEALRRWPGMRRIG